MQIQDSQSEVQQIRPPLNGYLVFLPESMKYVHEGGKKLRRMIFEGSTQFIDIEQEELKKFYDFLKQKNQEQVIQNWTEPNIRRFFLGCGMDQKKTLDSIIDYNNWAVKNLPMKCDQKVVDFMEKGIFYIQGRDALYRPIYVLQLQKLDLKIYSIEFAQSCISFLMEIAIKNMMLPGQIENQVFIMNFGGMKITDVPLGMVKDLIKFMQNTYRARLFKFYALNAPSSISFIWRMVKTVMNKSTADKINFISDAIPIAMFEHTNKAQVEQQFGGTYPDRQTAKDFWPPNTLNNDIEINQYKQYFVDIQEYNQKIINGQLKNHQLITERNDLQQQYQQILNQNSNQQINNNNNSNNNNQFQQNYNSQQQLDEEETIYYTLENDQDYFDIQQQQQLNMLRQPIQTDININSGVKKSWFNCCS